MRQNNAQPWDETMPAQLLVVFLLSLRGVLSRVSYMRPDGSGPATRAFGGVGRAAWRRVGAFHGPARAGRGLPVPRRPLVETVLRTRAEATLHVMSGVNAFPFVGLLLYGASALR